MLKRATLIAIGFIAIALLGSLVACAGAGGIRDSGKFFSDSARKEASRKVTEIEKQFHKELVVETFTGIPDEIKQGVDLTDKAAVSKMFEQWTVKEAKEQKVNGVYVLLSREPAHLQIVVGNETQNKAFTLKDRTKLASLMLAKLRAKENDEALLECVNFVATTMASHASFSTKVNHVTNPSTTGTARAVQADHASPWGWIITAVIGIAAVWLVFGLFRALMGGRSTAAGQGMMPNVGGGGMFGSILGGMFGAAAGMWLYDQFSGGHSNAWGGEQDSRSMGYSGYSGQDTDYSGTGGDFGGGDYGDSGGDSGGGGDF